MEFMDLLAKIAQCKKVFETEYYDSQMKLIYDYRSSLEHDKRFDHLPTPEEIAQRRPNPCGWASGMEDAVINGGVALDMYIDANDPVMAKNIFDGLVRCGTISGVPGMVVRSISPRDGKSFYPESSRDQYTHYVYSFWKYFHSDLSSAEDKELIKKLLVEVAQYCEKCVVPENNWTLNRADNSFPRSTVCKMWEVAPHEAARLPMCYAAAYDVSGDKHWFDMYRKFAEEAGKQSLELGPRSYHAYALLQMLCSCILIYEVETDAKIKDLYFKAMEQLKKYSRFSILRAADESYRVDYEADRGNWRKITRCTVLPDCQHIIPNASDEYAMSHRVIRELGEAILLVMLVPEELRELDDFYKRIFKFILEGFDPEVYRPYGALYVVAAYYKVLKLGYNWD